MATLPIPMAPNTANQAEMEAVFAQQKAYAPEVARTTHKERKAKIRKLMDYLLAHQTEIEQALMQDFRKHPEETILSELLVTIQEAKENLRHLKKWMQPRKAGFSISLVGTSGQVLYQPKGNVLIMAPWNYPLFLTIGPLISAIGAGNVCMVKPSEMTPHTSAFMRRMITDLFEEREVAVFEGNHEVAQSLLTLPFNHIFFTGSPAVGKIVMAAAAKHLSSVTLELGGKSPAIVDETANIRSAAEKIAWGKCLNNGQTCIAPDYVLVHSSQKEAFIAAYRSAIERMYGEAGPRQNPSYCRIVNARHFERIAHLMDDAIEKGASPVIGGTTDASENYIEPTVLTGLTMDMDIMEEEIFGPVLPLLTWNDREEVRDLINGQPSPLALYILSRSKQNVSWFLQETRSGDVTVNDTVIHVSHPGLPFGGHNNSGIGKSGGYSSFLAFSHERSVLQQVYGTIKPFYPPYNGFLTKAWKWLVKVI